MVLMLDYIRLSQTMKITNSILSENNPLVGVTSLNSVETNCSGFTSATITFDFRTTKLCHNVLIRTDVASVRPV